MPTYRLRVIDPDSHHLEASTHKSDAVVRAKDEKTAWEMAKKEFWVWCGRSIEGDVEINPWNPITGVVVCEKINDEEGPDQIIEPAGYEDFEA